MYKNNYILITVSALVLCFSIVSKVHAQTASSTLPDNVTVSSSPESYKVVITDKPGFTTEVSTTCENGQCTNTATSTPLNQAQIAKINDDMKAQEAAFEKLMQQQEAFFQAQNQYFQSLWNTMIF